MRSITPSRSSALEMRSVAKRFRAGIRGCSANVSVLKNVSLSIDPSEIVGVVAPQGAGKTTLLLCAAGLLKPDSGSVKWFGASGLLRPPGVTLCSNRPAPFAFLTVKEALEYHVMVHDLNADDRDLRVAGTIARTDLRADVKTRIAHLPVGALRRLAIAQAMLLNPKLILMDGLLADLDATSAGQISEILQTLASDGVAMLIAERSVDDVSQMAHRINWLADGEIAVRRPTLARRRITDLDLARLDDLEPKPLAARVGEPPPTIDSSIG